MSRVKLKTFLEIREDSEEELYANTGLNDAEKKAIAMWYDHRHVNDNERFVIFFNRRLLINIDKYNQLLRIQPGISQYDWLVQNYNENKTDTEGTTTTKNNGDLFVEEATTGTTADSSTLRTTRNTESTNEKTGNKTKHDEGQSADTTNRTYENNATRTEETNTKSGTEETEAGTTNTDGTVKINTKALDKSAPMSISYSGTNGAQIGDGAALDWQTVTSQTETQANTTTDEDVSNSSTRTNTQSGSATSKGEEQDSGRDGSTRTGTTENDTTEENTLTENGTEDTTETREGSGDKTSKGTRKTSTTNNAQTSGEINETVKSISTGRTLDPATLLTRAAAFIINTNAMEWLLEQLEPCFFGLYYEDEYEYTVEV